MQSSGFLGDAAIAAGHELGVFEVLARGGPMSLGQVASALGVDAGQQRLGALLDVLVALGAITCHEPTEPRSFVAAAEAPVHPVVPRVGWGLLADVIRRDQPLPIERGEGGEAERRLHHHLASSGAAAAAELAASFLGETSLLDLGAGAGAYSQAFLAAHPGSCATLVDTREVLAIAAEWLGPLASRTRLVAGHAAEADVGADFGAVLLANVLHLHGPAMCTQLIATAARAVAPGGGVVIKDLRVDDDRRGPQEGLLFALNMALYTEAGTVYSTGQLRAWLAGAGLVDIAEHRLAAAPDAIVVIARRPAASAGSVAAADSRQDGAPRGARGGDRDGARGGDSDGDRGDDCDGERATAVAQELDAALATTAEDAWRELVAGGMIRAEAAATAPVLTFPDALRDFLAAAVTVERRAAKAGDAAAAARADQLVRHYTEVMPRMRIAQLVGTDEPGATLFHAGLDWDRLPRLGSALDRLFSVLEAAGVDATPALGASSANAFRARTPTLAALYERTHYGGFMPLLYGFPADLAYMRARGAADGLDVLATIDRYLTAPIIHELCHFAPDRGALSPPHLDECIAGWLGVHVHPELAYPVADRDDALYAAPWLAQVGQAIARAFGVSNLVRAHAAGDLTALPPAFVAAAATLGWDDWCARRTLHFLSDTFDPSPWVALALSVGAGRSQTGATLGTFTTLPLASLELPDDPAFDRAIVEDALRAMCLASAQVSGSFRTRAQLPDGAVTIDAIRCAVIAPRRGDLDPVVPRYWLPPAVAARITASGHTGYQLQLSSIAAIPTAAAAICDAIAGSEQADVVLVPAGPSRPP